MIKKTLLAAAALAITATAAQASTQGVLATPSSTGSTVISTTIPNMVSITGLNDVTFNITADAINNPHFGGIDQTEKFCVYSNVTTAGNYNISVSGTAGSGNEPFALTGSDGNLNMAVWVSDDDANPFGSNGGGFTWPGAVKTGYKTTQGGKARATDLACGNVGGTNAALQLRLNDATILAAIAGAYTGTLTLTVSAP